MQAALVEVTMNSVTKTLVLKNAQGDEIAEDTHNGSTYVFNSLVNGDYTIWGYNSSDELNGTMTFSVGDADISMQIWTITKIAATNSGWEYGTDYTIEDVEVHSREGKVFPVTLGENAGNRSVLTYNGGSVILRLVPSAARVAEGYVAVSDGVTITGNVTFQRAIGMGGLFTSSCPADAQIALMQKPGGDMGSGTIHYVPFLVIEPESVETSGSTKTYTWRLGTGSKYNMRAWKTGGLTQLLTFYYNTDESKCPVINFTEADFSAKNPKWLDLDPKSLGEMNDCNILLNINEKGYLKMTTGQEYDLMAERDWQIIPDQTENYFLEPDYHYTIYDINGNPDNSVIEIVPDGHIGSEWFILRAKQAGTAIVTVTYDAASAVQYKNNKTEKISYYGGQYFGATWPENTGVFVVSVDAPANGMDANMRLNEDYNENSARLAGIYVDAEHDVFYYINDEEEYRYTFKPTGVETVEISYPTIRTNDAVYNTGWHAVAKNADNTYTLSLKHGRQIVRMGDGMGNYEYQVLTARHATRTITNETTGGSVFRPGDKIKVQYDGLFHPANKLSGIYNMSAYITYDGVAEGHVAILGPGQYWFGGKPAAQAYTQASIPADYTGDTYRLTRGVIQVFGFGSPIGIHRTIDKVAGRCPNFAAGTGETHFGSLPDVVVPVKQLSKTLATLVLNPEDAEIVSVTNSLGAEVTPEAGKYLLTEGENTIVAYKNGYIRKPTTITIEEGCPSEMTIPVVLEPVPADGWDGTQQTAVTAVGGIYHIKTGSELAWFAAQVTAGKGKAWKVVLDNDIDLCGYNWTPIGNNSNRFGGSFDGQGFTIENLHIETTENTVGLFSYLNNGAEVKNLVLRGSITSTCTKSTGVIGGLVGKPYGSSAKPVNISNITNYVNITGMASQAGGIVGCAQQYIYIDRCANYGNVTLKNETKTKACKAGGIAYVGGNNCKITNSYNCGNIIANNNVGGIYDAAAYNMEVQNVYNTGYVHATTTSNSGLSCHGAIRPCANTTATTAKVQNAYANEDFLFNELNTYIITDAQAWSGGEVAYKLGDAFGQEIGVDPLPVLGGKKVYQHEIGGKTYYSNYPQVYVREGLEDGKYGTLCFPYTAGETKGGEFYSIEKKYTEGGLFKGIGLVEETTVAAGKPYIFKATDEQIILFYNETDEAAAGQFNGLIGTFDYVTIPEGDWYIKDNGLKLAGEDTHASSYRAYIHAESITDASAGFAPSARRLIMGLERPMPTAVDAADAEQGTEKYIKNGRLYIRKDGQVYDAQGKRID